MSNIVPFTFEDRACRFITEADGSWSVVAKDFCEALDYEWDRNLIAHVPEQWVGVKPIHSNRGRRNANVLFEQGVYFFLGRSDKPKALPYQLWLAGEVVPSIRKTGKYKQTYGGAVVLQNVSDLAPVIKQAVAESVDHVVPKNVAKFERDTERLAALVCLEVWGGYCPVDKCERLVDPHGNPTPHAVFHHIFGRQGPASRKPSNCFITTQAHNEALRDPDLARELQPVIDDFSFRMGRYNAPLLYGRPPKHLKLTPPPANDLVLVPPLADDAGPVPDETVPPPPPSDDPGLFDEPQQRANRSTKNMSHAQREVEHIWRSGLHGILPL